MQENKRRKAMSEAAIKIFKEKLGALEKETDCRIEIVHPDFFKSVEANRLFADWFEPGTVLARAIKGDIVVTYDIVGSLDAVLVDSKGDTVRKFKGKFEPYNKALILIDDDRNLSTLNDGTDPSGCVLRFAENNHLRISVNNLPVEPIIAPDPSVARGILNREYLNQLIAEGEDANMRSMGRLDAEARARFDEHVEGKLYDPDDVLPEKPISDQDIAPSADMIPGDIPEYEEYMEEMAKGKEKTDSEAALELAMQAVENEKLEAEVSKPAKKTAKKKAAKETKEMKKDSKAEKKEQELKEKEAPKNAVTEPVRYDLLPLDVVGEFIEAFDTQTTELGFLASIEAYKKGEMSLLDTAVVFARANYSDAIEAVTVLAEAFEKNEKSEGDKVRLLNLAIGEYLKSLRAKDKEQAAGTVFTNLFCAACAER